MPLSKLTLRPGVNREMTNYANEGGFFVSEKVRFRGGAAQKIGGWQNITAVNTALNTFKGVARYLWNYVTSVSQNLLGVATNQKVYVEQGGNYNDITPLRTTATLGTDPIDTVSGSTLVTINATAHGAAVNTYIDISGATAVGGITLSGSYEIVEVIDNDSYKIVSPTAATSTATGGGAAVVVEYDINAGPAVATVGVGWGGPPWGQGGWGSNTAVGFPQRIWSMTNFGDDLIFAEREDQIYYWTADTTTWSRAVTLETKANSVVKLSTTATFASGSTTIVVPDASQVDTGSVISGSGIPDGAFVTTSWDGSVSLTISAATTAIGSATPVDVSYAGRHAPNETLLIIDSPVNDFLICMGSSP
jgi:hypothetical protein